MLPSIVLCKIASVVNEQPRREAKKASKVLNKIIYLSPLHLDKQLFRDTFTTVFFFLSEDYFITRLENMNIQSKESLLNGRKKG